MKLRIDISYKGTHYYGWQKQPDKPTVQKKLEHALTQLFKEPIKTQGSGRTDTGVHAQHQVVDFKIQKKSIKHYDIVRGLNRFLPSDIKVQSACVVPENFNSLKSAASKSYIYKILNTKTPCPLLAELTHWESTPLDIEYLNAITTPLQGTHDFTAFQTAGTELTSTVRTIYRALWYPVGIDQVWFEIEGNGFLKQMVRNIVGTLLDGHWEKRHSPESIAKILSSQDRKQAGSTAPSCGLYLAQVKYPDL